METSVQFDLYEFDDEHDYLIEILKAGDYAPEQVSEINTHIERYLKNTTRFSIYLQELLNVVAEIKKPQRMLGLSPDAYFEICSTLNDMYPELEAQGLGNKTAAVVKIFKLLGLTAQWCVAEYRKITADDDFETHMDDLIRMIRSLDAVQSELDAFHDFIFKDSVKASIKSRAAILRQAVPNPGNEVCLPVVSLNSASKYSFGRLTKVRLLHYSKEKASDKDIFHPLIRTRADESDKALIFENPLKAARSALSGRQNETSVRIAVTFEDDIAEYSGFSMGAAMASLCYLALDRLNGDQYRAYIKQGVAITGSVGINGDIGKVNPSTLAEKIKACFFGPVKTLVIPTENYVQAINELEKLKHLYPQKELVIIGVHTIGDILSDRRVMGYKKIPVIKQAQNFLNRNKSLLLAGISMILLFALIGQSFTPADRNAVKFELEKTRIILQNQSGQYLNSLPINDGTYAQLLNNPGLISFYDINSNGTNEVILIRTSTTPDIRSANLVVIDAKSGRDIWSRNAMFHADYSHNPDIVNHAMTSSGFLIVPSHSDQDARIVHRANLDFFPSVLEVLDLETGEFISSYLHAGHIDDLRLLNTADSLNTKIIFTGVNNSYREAVVGVLLLDELKGQSPAQGRHKAQNLKVANHLHYIRLPKTILFESGRPNNLLSRGRKLNVQPDKVYVRADDILLDGLSGTNSGQMVWYFTNDMVPVGLGLTSTGDAVIQNFLDEGKLQQFPFTHEYIEELLGRILYHRDGEWEAHN